MKKPKRLTDKERKLGFFLAGFTMAQEIVKEWLLTETRTGELMARLQARHDAIRSERRAEKKGRG